MAAAANYLVSQGMQRNIAKKRKEVGHQLDQVNDDFSDFSLSSPARKIRRLDAQLPPIMEEEEIEELENPERAIVPFKNQCKAPPTPCTEEGIGEPMEVEESESSNALPTAAAQGTTGHCFGGGWFLQWQQQQHCMIPQPPPITWLQS